MAFMILQTTSNPKNAKKLIQKAFNKGLTSCVQQEVITSHYLWKNKKKKYANRMRLVPIDSMDEMSDEGYGFADYDNEVSPERIVLKQNEIDMIQGFVKTLPEKYRIPIYLYYSADMQINEISKILGLPEGTVKSRMRKAKKQLKEKLEAIGYDR